MKKRLQEEKENRNSSKKNNENCIRKSSFNRKLTKLCHSIKTEKSRIYLVYSPSCDPGVRDCDLGAGDTQTTKEFLL